MSDLGANAQIYNVVSENELSVVLSHYNSQFVFDIVSDAIQKRNTNISIIPAPNIVGSLETNFKTIMEQYNYQDAKDEVMKVRFETYKEIINMICTNCNLSFNFTDATDLYSTAFYMYDFYVSNFSQYLISFFGGFILKERNSIYDKLNLAEMRKNKDSSTIYGKKSYKDIKLAIINANIDAVVYDLMSFDIRLPQIIATVIPDRNIANFLMNVASDNGDFFRVMYGGCLNGPLHANLISEIRFMLQKYAIAQEEDPNDIPAVDEM